MAGFTLLETLVSLPMVTLLGAAVNGTLGATTNADRYLRAVRKVTAEGEAVAYEIYDLVSASRRLFQADDVGNGYLDALDLGAEPLLAGARLGRIDETHPLLPDDAGDPRTGNVLLFAVESDPLPCLADEATGRLRYVDAYRFVCVYPRQTDVRVMGAGAKAHDLCVWHSRPYPSAGQAGAIADLAERRSVVRDLVDRYGCTWLWDAGAAAPSAFYAADATGTVSSLPDPAPVIERDPLLGALGGRLVRHRVQLAPTEDTWQRRAVLGADDPEDWQPNGFEVKMVGASGSRKVWIHLVVEADASRGEPAVQASSLIATTRDL
jgi:hypothetical protein